MIHYALRCAGGHEFDGWFKDSASFDQQARHGMLDCPVCADTSVERAIMAPNVRTRAARLPAPVDMKASVPAAPQAENAPVPSTAVSAPMPDQVRAVLQRIRAEVEKSCDYVGPRFAETARDMAAGLEPPRPIYGEATPEQEADLAEDGIEVARIPWVPRANG
jgi:hypothetical protein